MSRTRISQIIFLVCPIAASSAVRIAGLLQLRIVLQDLDGHRELLRTSIWQIRDFGLARIINAHTECKNR